MEQLLGRVMAIDLGEKRIGIAISDETRMIASSHSVILRKSKNEDFKQYLRIIEEHEVKLVVMGLPIPLGGEEGQRARWVRRYTEALQAELAVPVVFWDESLTTIEAESSLRARGQRGRRLRDWVDAAAAAFILQNYLDAHSGTS